MTDVGELGPPGVEIDAQRLPGGMAAVVVGQLEALHRAKGHKVFKEQISTRVKIRPELEKALAPAQQCEEAAPERPVTLTVHELKRLARSAAELVSPPGPSHRRRHGPAYQRG
ncbi:resolvase/integrase Bin [Streptomyces sp. L-9-10]|uniref:recombinase family protein n=1 Tax=Streptomyces sp. L-9-10 TaxID=1478131 RepID=UPI0010D3F704|nr:recombinase family protein [Streptomyces sp. L-9-10]RYJ23205.1 resolvase/integrase Bin [Streptomyces sp. L-9-10]